MCDSSCKNSERLLRKWRKTLGDNFLPHTVGYDTTTIRLRRIARACFHSTRFDASKKWTSIFRRSHVVVVSQSNRTQIVISITSVVVECVVVSLYRSRIAIVITVLSVVVAVTSRHLHRALSSSPWSKISVWWAYRYFRLSAAVAITWQHFLRAVSRSFRDISISGFDGHFRLSVITGNA